MSPETQLLADIHEATLNLLQMSSLSGVPADLHVRGLRGGLEGIRDQTEAAYKAVVAEEEGDFE